LPVAALPGEEQQVLWEEENKVNSALSKAEDPGLIAERYGITEKLLLTMYVRAKRIRGAR